MAVTRKLYTERHLIPGWGSDRRPEDRPGVPRERRPPRPDPGAHWGDHVPTQRSHYRPLCSDEYVERPPVFGTSCPLRGLSGWIRRRAFRRSEGDKRHWLMLLLADRIDVIEGSLLDLLRGRWAIEGLLATAAIGGAFLVLRRNPRGALSRRLEKPDRAA